MTLLNSLSLDLENIILDYQFDLDYDDRIKTHEKSFIKSLNKIKRCTYELFDNESERSYYDENDLDQFILYQYDYDTKVLMYWRVGMDTQLEDWIPIKY
jgi:hypothetical protein